jgi:hypothetical protein
MPKKHVVQLTADARQQCLELIRCGRAPARSIMHAQVLLKADAGPDGPGWTDVAISEAFAVTTVTVAQIRKVWVLEGLASALSHYRGTPGRPQHKLDGDQEAHLIALACSEPPEGRARWSLRLLSQRMVELGYVDSVSYSTVGRTLKKTTCSPGGPCASASRPTRAHSS